MNTGNLAIGHGSGLFSKNNSSMEEPTTTNQETPKPPPGSFIRPTECYILSMPGCNCPMQV